MRKMKVLSLERDDVSGDNDDDDDINFVLIHSSGISQILSTTFRVILLTNKRQ